MIADIIARLEKATGPDRIADAMIVSAFDAAPGEDWDIDESGSIRVYVDGRRKARISPPAYTASLEAALALVGEKLPGWWPELKLLQSNASAKVCCEGNRAFYASAPTAPIAVLIALFRALETA